MKNRVSITEYHDRISALSAGFRQRAAQAEEIRQIPEQSVAELKEAGLFRVFQPAKYGGAELSVAEVLPLVVQVAKACPSTAWVMAVLQIHPWMLGFSPDQVQDEVYADDQEAIVCGVLQPKAMAKRVKGGYELGEALWPYASGCDHASWAHVGGLVMNDNGPPEVKVFLLPKSDYEIVDDWDVTGLRGTGSKSLSSQGAFVAEHRTFSLADATSGVLAQERTALYQSAMLPMLCLNVTGPALGAARTTIETFIAHIENRNLPFSMLKQVDSSLTHQLLGEVMLEVESAELMLEKGAAMTRDYAEAGKIMPIEERSIIRAYSSAAVRQCVSAIESMFLASGGTALQTNHPLQQLLRDSKAMAAHAALSHENNLQLWGAVKLEKPLNSAMV
jgi:3-hydroxy-9,10-secoandrosta-1,3,5(10)-triene-9,17-dione monooxygenase